MKCFRVHQLFILGGQHVNDEHTTGAARAASGSNSWGASHTTGVSFQTGGNVTVRDSQVAGRDIHNTKIKNTVKKHPVASLAVLVVLLAGGGTVAAQVIGGSGSGSGIDTSVVSEAGAGGASDTTAQIRNAERAGDASAWCAMVAPSDGGCASAMQGKFDGRSSDYRAKVNQVGIGSPRITSTGAEVPLSFKGKEQGTVPLVWSGGRWQMSGGTYTVVKGAGGIFLSLIDAQNHQLSLFGIPLS